MIKIPCLFQRDFSDQRRPKLLRAVTLGCEWVQAGEGVATRKWDGTACLVRNGLLYARLDFKANRRHGQRVPPADAIPCQEQDPVTGHWPHWIQVLMQPQYKWHREAWLATRDLVDGTYECCGPALQGNPEGLASHVLFRHGEARLPLDDRSFDGIWRFLAPLDVEGIVFHHPDGRMAKIRKADYGMPRVSAPASVETSP